MHKVRNIWNDDVRNNEMCLPVCIKTQISKENSIKCWIFFCKDTIIDISNALENIIKKNNFEKNVRRKKISKKYNWKITSKNTFKFIEDIGSKN